MRLLPWEYGVRNMGRSPLRFLLGAAGSMLVVLLFLTAGAFVRGIGKALAQSGGARNVILLGAGSQESLERSEIARTVDGEVAASIRGVRRLGMAYVSPEVYMQTVVKLAPDDPREHQVVMRGVTAPALLVHDAVRVTDGRAPRLGADELLVGSLVGVRMSAAPGRLDVGQKLWFDKRWWTIVGRFDAPGTVMAAEIWLPLSDLQIAAKRDGLSSVILTLDEATLDDVEVFCARRLDLELVALTESEYFANLNRFYRPVRMMIWVTAALIAAGGMFGGLNTMYAAFAARIRELGALQAMGFSRRAIVLSLVQESVLIASVGALAAAAVAVGWLDGTGVRFSTGAMTLVIDGPVLTVGLAVGLALGVVGAGPPAWRCLRAPIPEALKAL